MNQASTGSTAMIALKHIFGVNSGLKNHVQFINDHKIVYPAGHNLVVYNSDDKTQAHILGKEQYKGFSTYCVSATRKVLAFAEKGEKPAIVFYEIIRQTFKKQFVFPDSSFKEVTAMAFAPSLEAKIFACLSSPAEGTGEVNLYYFHWDKAKHLDPAKVAINVKMTEVAFNPNDANTITCLGPGVFKSFKLQDQKLKQVTSQITGLPGEIPQTFTTHAWLNDGNVVVGTENGHLIILDSECEYKAVLHDSPREWKIESIIAYSKGFIIAGANMTVFFYETDPYVHYKKTQTLTWRNHEYKDLSITSLSIVPGLESKIVFTTQNNGVYAVNIKNENALAVEETPLEQLTESYHSGAILSMDVCTRKPLILTAGEDQTIRVWNFEDMKLECCKSFTDQISSVAIHPSGYIIAVGTPERVKLMYLGINNQLHETNRSFAFIKHCRTLKFSNGGHYLAAANAGSNSHLIHIISTYTAVEKMEFKGHTNKVKSLCWSKDDSILVSCGADGGIYSWKVTESTSNQVIRVDHPSEKMVAVNAAIIHPESKGVVACGTDKKLKDINQEELNRWYDTEYVLNCLTYTNSTKIIFAGVQDERMSGLIRCYKLPLSGSWTDHIAHDMNGVEAVRVTFDDQYLITAGRDGCIMIFEIKDKEARTMKNRDGYTKYADEIFMVKKDMDDLKAQKENQKNAKKEAMTQGQQFSLTAKDDSIKQLQEKQKTFLEAEQAKYSTLENNIKELQQEHIKALEAYKKQYDEELAEIESTYQRKTREEVSSFEGYKRIQEEKREEYREKITEMINRHNEQVRLLEERYNREIDNEINLKETAMNEREKLMREHDEIKRQIKEETNEEITQLEEKFFKENALLQETALKINSEVSVNSKKLIALELEENELNDKLREYEDQKKKLEEQKLNLKKDIEKHRQEIEERDRIITEKEKRIYELKKRAQELEKFKFVLDFKIKELRRDIGPRDQIISNMKKETNEMDNNLKKLSSMNNTLGLIVEELDRKQAEMRKHISLQSRKIRGQKNTIKSFMDDVHQAVQFIQDFPQLQTSVEEMKEKYAKDHVKTVDIDPFIYAEYISQRNYLEKSVNMLKKNLQKDNEIHRQDNRRIMRENVELIKAINKLRRENTNMKRTISGNDPKSPTAQNKDAQSEAIEKLIAEKKEYVQKQAEDISKLKRRLESLQIENDSLKPK